MPFAWAASRAAAICSASRNALVPFTAGSIGLLAGLLRRAGDTARSEALLREVEDPHIYGHSVDLVLYHVLVGQIDRAFDVLDILVDRHHPLLLMVVVGGPLAPALRASPRWAGFAARIGLTCS